MEPVSEPLGLVVADHALGEPAPYDPAEIVQGAATARGVDRLLNLLSEHSSALGFKTRSEKAFAFGTAPQLREMTILA